MSESPDKSAFVLRLEEEMERSGIADRADLSRKTSIPYHRLNPWFIRPGAKPNASDLLVLARLLNVSETYLLKGGNRREFQRMEALLSRAEALDEESQDDLESYLDFLEQRAAQKKSDQVQK